MLNAIYRQVIVNGHALAFAATAGPYQTPRAPDHRLFFLDRGQQSVSIGVDFGE